jgi:hypothetical protein
MTRWKERAKWQTAGGRGKGNCSSTPVLRALTSMAMCNGTVLGPSATAQMLPHSPVLVQISMVDYLQLNALTVRCELIVASM